MLHITRWPEQLVPTRCVHRPTEQCFAILPEDGSVETSHGTMTFRAGDCLIRGVDESTVYVIQRRAFDAAYEVS